MNSSVLPKSLDEGDAVSGPGRRDRTGPCGSTGIGFGVRSYASLCWIAIGYLSFVVVITWLTGHLGEIGNEALFFSSWTDAAGYRQLADYAVSLGQTERPPDYLLQHRDFLFPVYLGLYHVVGVGGMQLFQLMLNVLSLWCVYVALEISTRRRWPGCLACAILALTPSFTLLAFHALTETIALFLVSAFALLLARHCWLKESEHLPPAVGILSLLVCIRPIAFPFWVLVSAYYWFVWRKTHRVSGWQPILLASPIVVQALLSSAINGSPAVASVGWVAFEEWFFPVVYQLQEYGRFDGRESQQALEGLRRFPSLAGKLAYVLRHYDTSVVSYAKLLLGEHLLAGSNFAHTRLPGANSGVVRMVEGWSILLSRLFLFGHCAMFLVVLSLRRRRPGWRPEFGVSVCYLFAAILILPAGLAYLQGDRYMLLAEPLWLIAHGAVLSRFLSGPSDALLDA